MVFLHPLNGNCFICNEKCDLVSSDEENEERITSFKMFLRYLRVDLGDSTGVKLCETCSSRLNGFWELYQEFESLRLCLDDFVLTFHERMKTPSETFSNLTGREGRSSITKLRERVLKNCTTKLHSVPVIELTRLILPVDKIKVKVEIPSSPIFESIHEDIKMEVNYDIEDPLEDLDCMDQQEVARPVYDSKTELQTFSRIFKSTQALMQKPLTKVFSCTTCHKSFNDYKTLLIHKKENRHLHKYTRAQVKRLRKCNLCNFVIANSNSLKRHKVAKHLMEFYASKIPPGITETELQKSTTMILETIKWTSMGLECPFCSELFKMRCSLRCHIQIHHFDKVLLALENLEDDPLQEVQTNEILPERPKLVATYRKYLICNPHSSEKPLQCSICEKCFPKLANFQQHVKFSHPLVSFQNKLPPGTSQEDLDASIGSLLGEAIPISGGEWRCSLCLKQCKRKDNLKPHLLGSHITKIVQRLGKVSHHYINKTKSPKAIKRRCTEEFTKEENLTKIDKRKCNREDISPEDEYTKLKILIYHPNRTESPFQCSVCKERFTHITSFKTHAAVSHTLTYFEDELPSGLFQEELDTFVNNLLDKGKTHSKREWMCSLCSKQLSRKSHLKSHLLNSHIHKIAEGLGKVLLSRVIKEETSYSNRLED